MKIITKERTQTMSGLVGRVRETIRLGHKTFTLTTPVDVYSYNCLRGGLKKAGLPTFSRRRGQKVVVYVGKHPTQKPSLPARNPRLCKALRKLKPGSDKCVLLTTPLEVAQFLNLRIFLKRSNIVFRSARNCSNVMVWGA